MRRAILRAAVVMGLLGVGAGARGDEPALETVPPVVVKCVPEAGVGDVDPATAEIRVTFSQDMQGGTWSWATVSPASFPETAGKPSFQADRRTAVLPVKLAPGRTYAIWINSSKFHNFLGVNGEAAVPYLLVFRTKG